jgi:hypothetical protein
MPILTIEEIALQIPYRCVFWLADVVPDIDDVAFGDVLMRATAVLSPCSDALLRSPRVFGPSAALLSSPSAQFRC